MAQENFDLQFQMIVFIDVGEPLVKATYNLEGDGVGIVFMYDILQAIKIFFNQDMKSHAGVQRFLTQR
jgi:hypothetical protein